MYVAKQAYNKYGMWGTLSAHWSTTAALGVRRSNTVGRAAKRGRVFCFEPLPSCPFANLTTEIRTSRERRLRQASSGRHWLALAVC